MMKVVKMVGISNLQSGVIKGGMVVLFLITTCAMASYVPNQVVLKFKSDTPMEVKSQIIYENQCSMSDICTHADVYLLNVPESQTPEQMIPVFESLEQVEYAELNHIFKAFLVPNDPLYFLQWNLYDPNSGINIEKAWDIQTGDPNVVIAVLDSGAAYEDFMPYLKAHDLSQTKFVQGYDFINDDLHPNDDNGHGTHVTGTIAQSTNNNEGVAGVAFGCSIMPVKVLGEDGTGNLFSIINGIYFATASDANVINMSLGADVNSPSLKQAVQYAWSQDVTIICAAGNSFEDGNQPAYPAAYDDYCIAVGATRYGNKRAYYSNAGSYVDIVAPGGDNSVDLNGDNNPDGILQQTFDDNPAVFNYWFYTGTSSAAPHVSGAAALLISKGVRNPDKVRQAIENTAKDLGPKGWDKEYGWGLLDVLKSLEYKVAGDMNGDLEVGIDDLSSFSDKWLEQKRTSNKADFNNDKIVNLKDFALMAENWDK